MAVAVQREGSGRVRKPSIVLTEQSNLLAPPPISKANKESGGSNGSTKSAGGVSKATVPSITTSNSNNNSSGAGSNAARVHRPPPHVNKCTDLLREITKLPQSIWFAEPVDYIKLNIPDYPTIVKVPMDFQTIRQNLEKGIYDSADAFGEHVRLVFRNAITYNQLKDNPVHVAAKEVSKRFEERFRALLTNLTRGVYAIEDYQDFSRDSSRGTNNRKSSGTSSKTSKYTPPFSIDIPFAYTLFTFQSIRSRPNK